MGDFVSMPGAQPPDPTMALVEALRQRRADSSRQQAVGTRAQLLAGNSQIANAGKALGGGAEFGLGQQQHMEQQQAEAPGLQLRRALEQQALTKGQGEAEQTAKMRDPKSPGSVLRRALAKSFGMAVDPSMAASDIGADELGAAEKLAQMREATAARKAGAKAEKAPKPPPQLPATEAIKIGAYDAADKGLDDLAVTFTEKDPSMASRVPLVGGLIPDILMPDTAAYGDHALATAQAVGTILEGGKLTDADMPKYLRMLPQAGDLPERAAEKIRTVKKLLANRRNSEVKGARSAGFNTGTLGGSGEPAPHPMDATAVAWAKANPASPMSAQILKANGL